MISRCAAAAGRLSGAPPAAGRAFSSAGDTVRGTVEKVAEKVHSAAEKAKEWVADTTGKISEVGRSGWVGGCGHDNGEVEWGGVGGCISCMEDAGLA